MSLVNPKDGSKIPVDVHAATEDDVNVAVQNARHAFESGPWSSWTGEQRARCLNKLADLIDMNGEAIAYLESICSGRLLGMLVGEIARVSSTYRCESSAGRCVAVANIAVRRLCRVGRQAQRGLIPP